MGTDGRRARRFSAGVEEVPVHEDRDSVLES